MNARAPVVRFFCATLIGAGILFLASVFLSAGLVPYRWTGYWEGASIRTESIPGRSDLTYTYAAEGPDLVLWLHHGWGQIGLTTAHGYSDELYFALPAEVSSQTMSFARGDPGWVYRGFCGYHGWRMDTGGVCHATVRVVRHGRSSLVAEISATVTVVQVSDRVAASDLRRRQYVKNGSFRFRHKSLLESDTNGPTNESSSAHPRP
jgi:hypothetical protein